MADTKPKDWADPTKPFHEAISQAFQRGVEQEREACAKVAITIVNGLSAADVDGAEVGERIAAAIRARGAHVLAQDEPLT